VIAVTIQ